jgi:hypothetical protein
MISILKGLGGRFTSTADGKDKGRVNTPESLAAAFILCMPYY